MVDPNTQKSIAVSEACQLFSEDSLQNQYTEWPRLRYFNGIG
jgi:hypothetical protein